MSDFNINYTATFKTNNIFNIVGIGLVLTGQILDGVIDSGNYIQLKIDGVSFSYEISAVEFVDYMSTKQSEVGLVFDLTDIDFQENLNSILGQVILVYHKADL